MDMKRFAGMVTAIVLMAATMLISGAGSAQAAPTTQTASTAPQILWTGPIAWVHDRGETATVTGIYKCSAPLEQMHLWVSVKQGGPDPTAEGSSSTVDAWYDTNISQDVAVTCNGKWQFTTVDLGRHPTDFTGRPLGYLKNGKAWLQFCLVQGTDEATAIVASKSRWLQVIGAR
jgi:hypothetical protein